MKTAIVPPASASCLCSLSIAPTLLVAQGIHIPSLATIPARSSLARFLNHFPALRSGESGHRLFQRPHRSQAISKHIFDFRFRAWSRVWQTFCAFLVVSSIGSAGDLSNQFVTAKLAHGASVSVPRSWEIVSGSKLSTIETSMGAALDLSKNAKLVEGVENLLIATFPDAELYASVTITSAAVASVTPAFPKSLTAAQISTGETAIRAPLTELLSLDGTKVWGWTPLRKVTFGERSVMHTSYMRSSGTGDCRVHLYKFFGTGRIYDMALSTSKASESVNDVVLEKIARSFVGP